MRPSRRCLGVLQQLRPARLLAHIESRDISGSEPGHGIGMNTHHSELLERSRTLNILQRLLQILQLSIDLALGLLSALHSLRLKRLNGLDLSVHIILLDLKAVHILLELSDDVLVLEGIAIVGEVDSLWHLLKLGNSAARVVIPLLEVGEGVGCSSSEAELRAYC